MEIYFWEEEYNNSTDGNDYGTALIIDHSGDIVVVGTSFDLQNNNHDYTILKYDEDGTLLWSELFDGAANGHDIASSVTVDASDNIYVTGGSEGTGTLVDYCTVKFSSAGNFQWEARYDHQNMYDGAVSVKISGTLIAVTGGSGNDWTNGEIATVFYDSNGNEIAVRREESTETGYDQPYDLLTDNVGNIYVTGKVATANEGFNIKTIKLDEDLELVWVNEFDGYGMDDEGRSIALDELGNVYVTGTTAKPGGGSNIITIKYDDQGEQEWAKQQHTVPTHFKARGMRIAYEDDMLVVCGERERDSGTLVTTLGYSPEGKMRFMQNFSTDSIADHLVHSLSLYENNIYIHGLTQQTGADKYFALKYHYHHKESDYLYESGVPRRVEKELIIGFHPDLMKLDKIDHDHFMFAELAQFVDQSAINCINEKTGIDFSKQIATKIFPECHSWDTVSTSRLGKPVPIPKFWSTLLVELPPSVNDSLILDSIITCTKHIQGAYFNEVGEYSDCTSNDPYFTLGHQAGFGPTPSIPNAHVNIVDAWCLAGGVPEIKVGILDAGIKHNHEDLHDTPGSESYEGSDVKGGYYVVNSQLPPTPVEELPVDGHADTDFDLYFHGSLIAGIISGRRNNEIGIAGIAGKSNDSEGISLYDMTISSSHILSPGTIISRALYIAATDEDQINPNPNTNDFPEDQNYSLGLDIINCSFMHGEAFLKRAIEYCFRNDVVVVTASGNWYEGASFEIDDPTFPSSYKDEWVIKVGANDNTGGRAENFSVYGHNLDFIAPGVNDIYRSFAPEDLSNEFGYHYYAGDDIDSYTPTTVSLENRAFLGTSYAAPHVVGITALMKSYVDIHPQAPNKLSAEDVEHVMQSNVNNDPHFYDTPPEVGYDEETGYGRPNAGRILEKLQLPCYRVRHFEGSIQADENWSMDAQGTDVFISGANLSAIDQPLPFFGTYTADRYVVSHTFSHSIVGEDILEAWKRDAASNLALNTDELPGDGISVTLDSYNASSATLTGYVYKIYGEDDEIYWWPINPEDNAVFAYSIYTHDSQAGPCLTVDVPEEDMLEFNVYPNPAQNQVVVEQHQPTNKNLAIYNSMGSEVSGLMLRDNRSVVDISNFPAGIYLFVIGADENRQTFKIIKQ